MEKLLSELKQRYEIQNRRLSKYSTFNLFIFLISSIIFFSWGFLKTMNIHFGFLESVASVSLILMFFTIIILVILESLKDFFLKEDELRLITKEYPDLKFFVVHNVDYENQMRIEKLITEVNRLAHLEKLHKTFS